MNEKETNEETGFAPLSIDEIDFRLQSINKGQYATILAYKDARSDMKRLDERFGMFGWQKKYEVIAGNLFCSVGIYHKEFNQWIWKQDVGTESMQDKEKGQASDAFKRACFNLGVGRELYDYPVISIKLFDNEVKKTGDKITASWDLKLKEWTWTSKFKDGKLISLVAIDNNSKERYRYKLGEPIQNQKSFEPEIEKDPDGKPKNPILFMSELYNVIASKLRKKEVDMDKVKLYYTMTEEVEKGLETNLTPL